ncbi:DUF6531 domain-containing protein [Bradyrhizobium sp. USDA 4353]
MMLSLRAVELSKPFQPIPNRTKDADFYSTLISLVFVHVCGMIAAGIRTLRRLAPACFILALVATAADANPQLGYPIVVNNIPLTTQYVVKPADACQLAAQYPQYIIVAFYEYDVHLPLKFNGVDIRPNGSLVCYVADATRVAYEIDIAPPDCVSGYGLERGICTKDPSRGPPNSHAPEPQNQPDPCATDPSVGNPISLSGSSKAEDAVDFMSGGARPLGLVRHYRSRGTPGKRLGTARWHFDFEYEILAGNSVSVFSPDGIEYDFNQPTPGVYASTYSESKSISDELEQWRHEHVHVQGRKRSNCRFHTEREYLLASVDHRKEWRQQRRRCQYCSSPNENRFHQFR